MKVIAAADLRVTFLFSVVIITIMARFIIIYNSTTGNTKAIADAIAGGAQSLKLDTEVVDAFDAKVDDLMSAEAIGFGVPTFNYHPARPVLAVVEELGGRDVNGKIAVVFGSYGWSGEGPVVVAEKLRQIGFRVLDPVIRIKYKPTENEIDSCKLLGKDVAKQLKHIEPVESLNR
jgi:flavorubredoxin